MRIPNEVHEARPWRIRAIASDFRLEDVWALPADGRAEDFPALLALMDSFDPGTTGSGAARSLWRLRVNLGRLFGLDRVPRSASSLASRVPADLRNTTGAKLGATPFVPLYRTDVEFAAELSNRTVHGVLHLGWAEESDGNYRGQLAVYVKPRGRLGKGYMAFIKPFRYLVVYPALMRKIERAWDARTAPTD